MGGSGRLDSSEDAGHFSTDAERKVAAAIKGNTPARNRMAAILQSAAMDLWDVATEEDSAQMWED